MSAVVLLSGTSGADALGGIGRSFKTGFTELGHEFIEVNLADKARAITQINALIPRNDIALTFSFMSMGSDVLVGPTPEQNQNLWAMKGIPYIAIYGDTPAYFFDRHVFKFPGFIGFYGFPEHYELRKRLPHIRTMFEVCRPFAIDTVPEESLDFKRKAEGDLIFLKNGKSPQELFRIWREALPKPIGDTLFELAAELTARIDDPATNQVDDIVQHYYRDRGIDITGFTRLRLFVISQLDDFMRRHKGTLVVEALLDLPVLVLGIGWDHIDFRGRKAQLVPGGHFDLSRGLIRDSVGTLDISPNTGGAPHDRALRAFGSRTLCLTNTQEFFTRELPQADYFSYRLDPEHIRDRAAAVLGNKKQAVEIGREVAAAFLKKFKSDAFARQLLTAASCVRFNELTETPEGLPNYIAWPPEALKDK